jgi:hypothetical protein
VSTTPNWRDEEQLDLQPGKYHAMVTLNKPYQDYFGITGDQAVHDIDITVVNVDERTNRAKAAAARAAETEAKAEVKAEKDEHAAHLAQGDPDSQVAAYDPEFRPPAKLPAAVKLSAIPKGPRPDLRSLPAWGIQLDQQGGKDYVDFSATVWNGGTSPLLVDGFRRTGEDLMDAYQYFFDASGKEVGSVEAGTMEWDPREGHRHWHFTDFAQYNLLSADKALRVRSGKEAFCLVNTDAVDYTVPNAKWRPSNTDLSSSCGQNTAVAVREVLDIGNGDTYGQYLPGQSFDITDLPNGTYFIEVKANPSNKLAESDTANNSALREIRLGGEPGARTIEVPSVNGLD